MKNPHPAPRRGLRVIATLLAGAVLAAAPGRGQAQGGAAVQLELPGSVDLLPPGDLTLDGSAQSLAFVVTDETGGFPAEATFKFTASEGRIDTRGNPVGPGIHSFAYTPPVGGKARSASLKVVAKVGRKTVERTFTLDLVPPPTAAFEVASNPPQVVLDPGATALVRIAAKGRDGQPALGLDLKVTANSGTVGALRSTGPGTYEAVYSPAAVNYPHLAILALADARNPESALGFFTLPLVGKVAYPVTTGKPGATVTLEVSGQTFGPAVAGADGSARVPIHVPPGVRSAKLVAIDGTGARQETMLDLQTPAFGRVKIAPVAGWLPGDAATPIPVRIAVADHAGRPSAGEQLQVTCDKGRIAGVRDEGNGLYTATLTLDPVKANAKATLSATLKGEEQTSKDAVTFDVVPALPRTLTLATDPAAPRPGASVQVKARLTNAAGAGMAGLGVEVRTAAGTSKVKDAGDGNYTASVPVPAAGTVLASVASVPAGGARAPFALVGWGLDDQVPVGQKLPLTVMAVDRYGLPVSGQALQASLLQGGGAVSTPQPTDASGRSVIELTAGPLAGLAVVEVRAGALLTRVPVWQAKARLEGFAFPLAGGSEQARLQQTWGALRDRRELGMKAPAPVVAAPAPVPAPAAPAQAAPPPAGASSGGVWGGAAPPESPAAAPAPAAARIELTVTPESLPRDGVSTARVVARVVDGQGKPVAGKGLLLLASAGTLVDRTSSVDGTVGATLVAPSSGADAVTVSAAAGDASLSAFRTVALTAATAAPPSDPAPAATAASDATPAATEVSPGVVGAPRSVPAPARRFRLAGGWILGAYTYDGGPCDHDSRDGECDEPSDVDETYDVFASEIGAPASYSFGVDAEFFPVEYVGVGGGVESFGYRTDDSVETDSGESATFGDQMWHIRIEARGRLPLKGRMGTLDLMPRLGYHGQDVLVFRWVRPAATSADPSPDRQRQFETRWMHGLDLGLGLRWLTPATWLEPHFGYAVTASFDAGGITNHDLTAGVSFHPTRWLLLDAAYRMVARDFGYSFEGSDADGDGEDDTQRGEVAERTHALRLTAGITF